jgi:hypothetical protein
LLAVLLMAAFGCTRTTDIEALEVLNYGQCTGVAAGLSLVDYADLPGIRGGALLTPADDAATGLDTSVALVAISRGPQPTPGYGFTLLAATSKGGIAELRVNWYQPPADAVMAQVITDPCLVVALPRANLERIEAIDQTGNPLGSTDLP